jgi:hypothetical protein
MERLKKEIFELTDKLEKGLFSENSVEALVLSHLNRILNVMDGSAKDKSAGVLLSDLRQFWLDSVPWCSELSKDIEKLIILVDDLVGEGLISRE